MRQWFSLFKPPRFDEVGSMFVSASLCLHMSGQARILKFHVWIPPGKRAE